MNVDFDIEEAVAKLLQDGILYCNHGLGCDKKPTICLYINCNDTFAYACADGLNITSHEVEELMKEITANPKWGGTIWCLKKENLQPVPRLKQKMIEEGAWSEELEGLKRNGYDKERGL